MPGAFGRALCLCSAFDRVRAEVGSLGANNAIDYRADAGAEAREGQILCRALVNNFSAMKAVSKAVMYLEEHWKVACAQADEDQTGTISAKEAMSIWERVVIEMTRTCTAKLEKLGVNPVPLVLAPGDLCMVRESGGRGETLHLATYVDESHAIPFDHGGGAPIPIIKVGPATQVPSYSDRFRTRWQPQERPHGEPRAEPRGEPRGEPRM